MTTNPTWMRHAVRRRAWRVSAGAWVPTAGAPMRSDQLYVPSRDAPTLGNFGQFWGIGDCVTCYGFGGG
eukprot:scaffold145347_cov81-Phaeocystis_antarctica.AAC.1